MLPRLLLAAAALAVALLAPAGARPALAQEGQLALYLDVDTADGPCTDIDTERTVAPGETFQVGVCVKNLPREVGVFEVDVLYDLDVLFVPEVPDEGLATDDNPDANAGATYWGDALGDDFDCSMGGVAYPQGNRYAQKMPGNRGAAFISCATIDGPWWLGDDEKDGVLAVITMQGENGGTTDLAFTTSVLGDGDATELGSCDPGVTYPMPCNGASIHVTGGGSGLGWAAFVGIGVGAAALAVGVVLMLLYLRRRRPA